MYIEVMINDGAPALQVCEQDDFTSFKIVVVGDLSAQDDDLAQALARLGPRTEAGVLVPPALVISLAGRDEDADWLARFGQMLEAAGKYGWVQADGSVQAHVELRAA